VAEPGQFFLDATISPLRVLSSEVNNQLAQRAVDAGASCAGRVGPFSGDKAAMPGQQGRGSDELMGGVGRGAAAGTAWRGSPGPAMTGVAFPPGGARPRVRGATRAPRRSNRTDVGPAAPANPVAHRSHVNNTDNHGEIITGGRTQDLQVTGRALSIGTVQARSYAPAISSNNGLRGLVPIVSMASTSRNDLYRSPMRRRSGSGSGPSAPAFTMSRRIADTSASASSRNARSMPCCARSARISATPTAFTER
jgi:hypothetical protein